MVSFFNERKRKAKDGMAWEMWLEAKWMSRYVIKYWKAILYYIVLGIFGTAMGLAGSLASKYLIDAVSGYEVGNINNIVIILICMVLGNIAVAAATSRISAKISLKVNNEIQSEIYDKIMNSDWEAISIYHGGDLLKRFGGDVNTVADSVIGWIPSLCKNLLQFLGSLLIILYFDPIMAVIALIGAPVTIVLSKVLVRKMRDYNKKMKQAGSDIYSFSEESFQNIQIIKCFDLIRFFGKRLRKEQKSFIDIALNYNKFSIFTSSFMSIVGSIVLYATFGWGVYRLSSGAITFGTMTLFLQMSGNLSGGFSELVGMVPTAIGATTSAGRIMAIAELPKEKDKDLFNVGTVEENSKLQGLKVELSDIRYSYAGREKILEEAFFCATPGETVAIIGPSGEGKTTLLRILLGLLNPMSGEAKLIDCSGTQIRISSATRRFFSYVPQGNTVFSGTIADNLKMVHPDAGDEELTAALKAACAYEFVESLPEGIQTKIGEKGIGLSEGQAQRIAIARALLRNAPILLLDEATSALDIVTEKRVISGIMSYRANRTCILTTHRPSVLTVCDRAYQIKETQIVEFSA